MPAPNREQRSIATACCGNVCASVCVCVCVRRGGWEGGWCAVHGIPAPPSCRPLTQRVLQIKPVAGQQGMVDPWAEAAAQAGAAPWAGAPLAPSQSQLSDETLQREQASAVPPGGWAQQRRQQQHAASAGQPPTVAWQQQAVPASFASSSLLRAAPQPSAATSSACGQPVAGSWQPAAEGALAMAGAADAAARRPQQLPVSAVSAGLAPDRQGSVPTGAEVCVDALMEELIAQQALLFFQQQQQGQRQDLGQQENRENLEGQLSAPTTTAKDTPSVEAVFYAKDEQQMEETAAAIEPLKAAAQATMRSAPAQSPKRRGRTRKAAAAHVASPRND